jgi:hypothetical protein
VRRPDLTDLCCELLDAHVDTLLLAREFDDDPLCQAHLEYLRDLQRAGREALALVPLLALRAPRYATGSNHAPNYPRPLLHTRGHRPQWARAPRATAPPPRRRPRGAFEQLDAADIRAEHEPQRRLGRRDRRPAWQRQRA